MIIVLGSVVVQPGKLEEALALSQAHVLRSRAEPGCIAHAVHLDSENPQRLVFVERWADQAALQVHFSVPESGQFVAALTRLLSEPPEMTVYAAEQLQSGL
jgi:quinol monooxygenase YgiN